MNGRRPRVTLGRAMLAVAGVALVLASGRFVSEVYPHARECWTQAAVQNGLAQACRSAAARYRACPKRLPCATSDFCSNMCIEHADSRVGGRPGSPEVEPARAAEAHRRAAEDHERAAGLYDARARAYRRVMFSPSRPMPTWTVAEEVDADVFHRYQCDVW